VYWRAWGFDDGSFDAAVASLVLCSVPDSRLYILLGPLAVGIHALPPHPGWGIVRLNEGGPG
jgi:hypothetical protein